MIARYLWGIFIVMLVLMAPVGAKPVGINDEVPDFTLVDQDNKKVSLASLRGKLVMVTFLFTRCPYPDKCPMINQKLGQTRELMEKLKAGDKFHVLAVSLDPRYDTPEVLKAYAQGYDQAYSNYSFLTGKPEAVAQVAALFGVIYWEENGTIEHNIRTAIIGPDGKLRVLLRGSDWKVGEVAARIKDYIPKDKDKE